MENAGPFDLPSGADLVRTSIEGWNVTLPYNDQIAGAAVSALPKGPDSLDTFQDLVDHR